MLKTYWKESKKFTGFPESDFLLVSFVVWEKEFFLWNHFFRSFPAFIRPTQKKLGLGESRCFFVKGGGKKRNDVGSSLCSRTFLTQFRYKFHLWYSRVNACTPNKLSLYWGARLTCVTEWPFSLKLSYKDATMLRLKTMLSTRFLKVSQLRLQEKRSFSISSNTNFLKWKQLNLRYGQKNEWSFYLQ